MGAGPWLIYNSAKKNLMNAQINLEADQFWVALYQNTSNAADLTMVNVIELNNEVAAGNGYVAGGQQCQNTSWDVGAYPDEMRFNADTLEWQASGGTIAMIQYAVLMAMPSGLLVAVSMIDENTPITVPDGDPLVVGPGDEGFFELN